MSNASLNHTCNDENDPMMRVTMLCKHGDLLHLQTSWSEKNPARRFWSCPRTRENSCKFFRWRDLEEIDMRSKSVIPRLANKIKELEEALPFYESKEKKIKLVETKDDQGCHDKVIKERQKKINCCVLNWKLIVVLVVLFFLVLRINKNMNDGKCSCMHLELP